MQRGTVLGAVFSLSLIAHLAIGAGIAAIPKDTGKKQTFVSVVSKKKKKEDKKDPLKDEPPPPPKPKDPPRAAPKPKPAPENTPPPPANSPPPSAAAHPQLAALPNLNINMAGGPGAPGVAVPTGPAAQEPAPAAGDPTPKVAARPKDDCTEEAVKPKLIGSIPQERIIAAAQAAGGVEGRIRLELLVDENGNVTSVRVMTGLGGGVDEAAVAAAKRFKVTASTKCGRPVAGRLVVAMTVRNPD